MTDDKKPREWPALLIKGTNKVVSIWHEGPGQPAHSDEEKVILIEKSAFDTLALENKRLRTEEELQRLSLVELSGEFSKLQIKLAKVVEALKEIEGE